MMQNVAQLIQFLLLVMLGLLNSTKEGNRGKGRRWKKGRDWMVFVKEKCEYFKDKTYMSYDRRFEYCECEYLVNK